LEAVLHRYEAPELVEEVEDEDQLVARLRDRALEQDSRFSDGLKAGARILRQATVENGARLEVSDVAARTNRARAR